MILDLTRRMILALTLATVVAGSVLPERLVVCLGLCAQCQALDTSRNSNDAAGVNSESSESAQKIPQCPCCRRKSATAPPAPPCCSESGCRESLAAMVERRPSRCPSCRDLSHEKTDVVLGDDGRFEVPTLDLYARPTLPSRPFGSGGQAHAQAAITRNLSPPELPRSAPLALRI